jgi:hypothetical protein
LRGFEITKTQPAKNLARHLAKDVIRFAEPVDVLDITSIEKHLFSDLYGIF